MDMKAHLLLENSRKNWDAVVAYVGEDEERYAELVNLFLTSEMRVVQRASQPLGYVAEKHPRLIRPYLKDIVTYLQSDPIDAVKRNTLRMFQFIKIPEELEGDLFDTSMRYLASAEEAVAIKAFAMTVARRICEKYPELALELIYQIEILVKEEVSVGLTNRGQRELIALNKITAKL